MVRKQTLIKKKSTDTENNNETKKNKLKNNEVVVFDDENNKEDKIKINDIEDTEDDNEEADEEYIVERVEDTKLVRGKRYYLIKWEGYSSDENTWEPEEDCDCEQLILEFQERRRNEQKAKSQNEKKSRKRRRVTNESESEEKEKSNDVIVYKKEDELPYDIINKNSWEDLVECVESLEEEVNDETGERKLRVYLLWKDNTRTVHYNNITNIKCPQKMINFYESHLRFQPTKS